MFIELPVKTEAGREMTLFNTDNIVSVRNVTGGLPELRDVTSDASGMKVWPIDLPYESVRSIMGGE